MSAVADLTSQRTGGRRRAWAVLVAAVAEIVAPLVTINGPGSSPGGGSGPDLLITPVGWAFSIWGVIYTLAVVQAIAVLVRGENSVSRRLQIDLVVLYLGGALWIVAAGLDNSLATAAVLLVMFVAALDAVLTAARESIEQRGLAILTRAAVGLYAGWVTAAFFLNVSTALVDAGAFEPDDLSWQIGALLVAVVILWAVLIRSGGIFTYAAAGTWAMIGIAVTGADDGTTEVVVVASASGVVLVVTTLALRLSRSEDVAHIHP